MAKIIAEDIINMRNIGDELLFGPRSDRTRQMLETSLRPAVDNAVGFARTAVRVGMGTEAVRPHPRRGGQRGGRVRLGVRRRRSSAGSSR